MKQLILVINLTLFLFWFFWKSWNYTRIFTQYNGAITETDKKFLIQRKQKFAGVDKNNVYILFAKSVMNNEK